MLITVTFHWHLAGENEAVVLEEMNQLKRRQSWLDSLIDSFVFSILYKTVTKAEFHWRFQAISAHNDIGWEQAK